MKNTFTMANKQKKVIVEMCEQDWFALEEYVECYKKMQLNLALKHGIPIIYLILIGFGIFMNVHWYFILSISAVLSFIYFKNIPKLNHRIKSSKMAMFLMEIEFGFSKLEDDITLGEDIKKIIN
jgi:hypothetical protein